MKWKVQRGKPSSSIIQLNKLVVEKKVESQKRLRRRRELNQSEV
jgi:hypothetical protein